MRSQQSVIQQKQKNRMTEDIFQKCKNLRERHIVYDPRTGDEMQRATLNHVPIYKYSELCEMANKHGPARMLANMFKRSNSNVVLLQDPKNMNSGHWISVSRNLPRKEIYFFSTYGGKPDVEKVQWIKEDDLWESGQMMNIFNDGLREMQKHGWEIHYNDFPYQKSGDKTAVCGIYTAAFLRSGEDPEKFEQETKYLARHGINPAVFYYDKYFT